VTGQDGINDMATSAISATTQTSNTSGTSSSVNSSALMSTLGAGSGIDTKSLAQNLVDAERAPQADRINAKIKSTEARITGYGALKSALSELMQAYKAIDDASDIANVVANSSQTAAFTATANSQASPGNFDISVVNLAKATRYASASYSTNSTTIADQLNLNFNFGAGSAKNFSLTVNAATPDSVVAAINAQTPDTGVSASLINTGSGYKVMVSGAMGTANDFTLTSVETTSGVSSSNAFLGGASPSKQSAVDATLEVNGVTIQRASNSINDLIPGVTLNLLAPTTGTGKLDLSQDASGLKQKLQGLVDAYNTFNDSMAVLGDRTSKIDVYGGALAGDSLLRTVRQQMRSLLTEPHAVYTDPANPSGTPLNANLQYGWQLGLGFDRFGKLSLDSGKFDTAVKSYPEEVSLFLSAGSDNKSMFSSTEAGMAGNAVRAIDNMLRSNSLLDSNTQSAQKQLQGNKEQLTALDARMKVLLDRYTQQFSAMDALVGNTNSLKTSLSGTFDGMMSVYTRK
jgi:flagellar hook-associated protein 2